MEPPSREHDGEIKPVCPPLGALESVLRPYQRRTVSPGLDFSGNTDSEGVGRRNGSGKTLQVLAHLLFYPPTRVVRPWSSAPRPFVFNWAAEAERFTLQLRTLVLSGFGPSSAVR